MYKPCPMAAR